MLWTEFYGDFGLFDDDRSDFDPKYMDFDCTQVTNISSLVTDHLPTNDCRISSVPADHRMEHWMVDGIWSKHLRDNRIIL